MSTETTPNHDAPSIASRTRSQQVYSNRGVASAGVATLNESDKEAAMNLLSFSSSHLQMPEYENYSKKRPRDGIVTGHSSHVPKLRQMERGKGQLSPATEEPVKEIEMEEVEDMETKEEADTAAQEGEETESEEEEDEQGSPNSHRRSAR